MIKAEYDRLRVLNAIRNSVKQALIPDIILAVWNASFLFPFKEEPPYHKEDEDKLHASILATAIMINVYRPVPLNEAQKAELEPRSLTGVVNSPTRIGKISSLITKDLEAESCEGQCEVMVSEGPLTAVVDANDENADVGDYLLLPGADGIPGSLPGASDADCFVTVDESDMV